MTQTGIANLALSHLGASQITAITDATVEAEAIRDCWDAVRNGLIRAHRWNFAKTRAYLTPVVWGESFALPTDCLRVVRVNGVDQSGTVDEGAEIEGRTLRLAATTCEVVYLRIIENPDDWDALFTIVFGYELAAAVGPRLANGSQSLASEMRDRATDQLQIAMAANAIETKPTIRRAIEGSRYLEHVWGSPVVRSAPSAPAPPTTAPAGSSSTPVITIVQGTDGAWYEKTTMPDGTEFFKPVFTALP
jgi:hypothetical protein